jgi:hypothetical protein
MERTETFDYVKELDELLKRFVKNTEFLEKDFKMELESAKFQLSVLDRKYKAIKPEPEDGLTNIEFGVTDD